MKAFHAEDSRLAPVGPAAFFAARARAEVYRRPGKSSQSVAIEFESPQAGMGLPQLPEMHILPPKSGNRESRSGIHALPVEHDLRGDDDLDQL